MQIILGIFSDRPNVESAIDDLRDKGFNPKDMSIVMKDNMNMPAESKEAKVAEGTVSGAATGAVVGGLAGLLAAVALPGLGAFLIGGPIAIALGLTGVAAATASGVVTGAVAGGLLGALISFGLSKEDAAYYESRVKEGAILLAVPVDEGEAHLVRRIFDDNNATDMRTISQTEEEISRVNERTRAEETPATRFGHMGVKGGKGVREEEEE